MQAEPCSLEKQGSSGHQGQPLGTWLVGHLSAAGMQCPHIYLFVWGFFRDVKASTGLFLPQSLACKNPVFDLYDTLSPLHVFLFPFLQERLKPEIPVEG